MSRDQFQTQGLFLRGTKSKKRGRSWTQWHVTVLSYQIPETISFIFAPNYLLREQVSFGTYFSRNFYSTCSSLTCLEIGE